MSKRIIIEALAKAFRFLPYLVATSWLCFSPPASAQIQIPCGQVITASIDTPNKEDRYTFTGGAGDVITLRLASTTNNFIPLMELHDPDGQLIAFDSSVTTSSLSKAGSYTVLISYYFGSSQTGGYQLVYQNVKNPCNVALLACGTIQTGSINPTGELDAYAFSVAAGGDVVTLRLASTTGNFVPLMELYDPDGQLVAFDSSMTTNSLNKAGNYTVLVSYYYGSSQTGSYQLVRQSVKNPCNALPLVCGTVKTGVVNPAGDLDTYTFSVAAGEAVTLRLAKTTNNFTPLMELYDPDGQLVADDSSVITGSLSKAGSYTVLVRYSYGSSLTGDYQLVWQRTKNPCNPIQIMECQTVRASINTQGGLGAFVLNGTAGRAAVLSIQGFTTNFSPQMELYDPDGRLVSIAFPTIAQNLVKTGVYTVLVRPASGSLMTGNYNLSMGNTRVTLLTPNGGEVLFPGSALTISWESSAGSPSLASHDIVLSTNSGVSYPTVIANGLPANRQSFDWNIPSNLTTSKGRIRVMARDAAGNVCQDESDADFTVLAPQPTSEVSYKYDELNRLTQVTYDSGNIITYTYDAVGNRLSESVTFHQPPIANPQSVTTDEDVPKAITLSGNAPDGSSLSFTIISNPSHGSLSGTGPNLTYRPEVNYNGADNFSFRVNDGVLNSKVATVSITINPVNDAPILTVPGPQTVNTGQNLSFTITASDVDVGDTLTFTATSLPNGATLTPVNATSARFSWTPGATQVGSFVVSFKVSDNGVPVLSDTKTVAITVVGQWAPTATLEGGQVFAMFSDGTNLFAGTFRGVFRSTDQGQSWTFASAGLRNGVPAIFAFAGSGTNLFVGSFNSVFRSTNQGQSWTNASAGLPSREVRALAVSGANLFAGTAGGGVYLSTDNGQSWTAANIGLPPNAVVRALAVSGPNVFAGIDGGGVFLSTNQGQSWMAVNNGLTNLTVRALAVSGTNLFAGTNSGGVFLSTNQGQSWVAVNNGLTNLSVQAFIVSGANLFAGTNSGGVFLSTNNGQTWANVRIVQTDRQLLSLAVSGTRIFAGTNDDGVFVSTNQGQSWTAANAGLTAVTVSSLAVGGANLFAGTYGGVYRSINQGQSWTAVNTGLGNRDVQSLAASGTNLYAGTNNGVYLTTNNGQSWMAANAGLPVNTSSAAIFSLAVSGANLFAGTNGSGVYLSTNQGQSWTAVNAGLLPNAVVQELAVIGSNLFAGIEGGGIYLSANNGQSWTAANNGLTNLNVRALAVSETTLLAGTFGGGVFRSTNQGQSWTAANVGLPGALAVHSFAVSGTNLFAGTEFGGGVYLSTNQGQSWAAVNAGLANFAVFSLAVSGANLFAGTGAGVFITQF